MIWLQQGYNFIVPPNEKINLVSFQNVVSLWNTDEITNWEKENKPDYSKIFTDELILYLELNSHWSAIMKVTDYFRSVFFGNT